LKDAYIIRCVNAGSENWDLPLTRSTVVRNNQGMEKTIAVQSPDPRQFSPCVHSKLSRYFCRHGDVGRLITLWECSPCQLSSSEAVDIPVC